MENNINESGHIFDFFNTKLKTKKMIKRLM